MTITAAIAVALLAGTALPQAARVTRPLTIATAAQPVLPVASVGIAQAKAVSCPA
jgi:hypothetical protein